MFDEIDRDKKLNKILDRNPSASLFKNIRKSKSENNGYLIKLHVNKREQAGAELGQAQPKLGINFT